MRGGLAWSITLHHPHLMHRLHANVHIFPTENILLPTAQKGEVPSWNKAHKNAMAHSVLYVQV